MTMNVESMFYVRETPWHGLGTRVNEALNSKEALTSACLDWNVIQESIHTETNELIEGYKANIRNTDRQILGVSQTAIRLCRIRKPLLLQMNCWEKVYDTKPQAVYKAEEKYGYWHICHMSILFPARESACIWYFSTPMMVPGQSK